MSVIAILSAFALSTRFFNLSTPTYVCWDETHFGSFAGHYINRTYFADVHPPLGKMLIAVIGLLTGYDGKFAFTSPGDEYITDHNRVCYYGMRAFSAILGSIVVPLLHCTVKNLTGSEGAALLTALLLIFDCGLVTLSQYILLDPILLFFTSLTLFCTTKYSSRTLGGNCKDSRGKAFQPKWWLYLALSGLFLGCTVCVKWTGLFTAFFLGCWNAKDLWEFERKTLKHFLMHFSARALCLILIPSCVYVSIFALHYQVLNKSGKADGFHSSLFQSCLKGNPLHNTSMPHHLAYGSVISLKYHRPSASGLLHSYNKPYPLETLPVSNQQVSLYYHRDVDNFWEVVKPLNHEHSVLNSDMISNRLDKDDKFQAELLRDGSLIRLMHVRTKHYLKSQPTSAVLSPAEYVVFAHNDSNEMKMSDLWELDVVDKPGVDEKIKVLATTFRLIHASTGCFLRSTVKVLPEWGEKKYEVTCSPHWYHGKYSSWNIEQHTHRHMENVKIFACQMTFWERFFESHFAMLSFNLQFQPSENGSRPWHWPLNYKGQVFSRMREDSTRIYLLGNPLVFWLNLLVLLLSSFLIILVQRRMRSPVCPPSFSVKLAIPPQHCDKTASTRVSSLRLDTCKLLLLGWAIHYLPFYFVSREVYLHHYYTAFIFNCCLSGCFLDFIFTSCSEYLSRLLRRFVMPSKMKSIIYSVFILCLIESFYLYSPLCYGMTGPFSDEKDGMMHGLKIFDQWDI